MWLWLWYVWLICDICKLCHYPSTNSDITPSSFKVFPLEKLTSILTIFSPTSLNTFLQTFYYFIYTISLLYTSLVTFTSWNLVFFTISNFSCFFTSTLILLSNSATTFFIFSKSFFFSYILCSIVNLLYYTKYFITSLNFHLFNIFSTSYSSTSFTLISFISSTLCFSTSFLYLTTWLMFTIRSILIEFDSLSLTTLIDTTSSTIYRLIYYSVSFLASLFLNIKSFMLNITLSSSSTYQPSSFSYFLTFLFSLVLFFHFYL